MVLLTQYEIESVLGVRMSSFSDKKQLSFKGVKISAMKNAFTLAKMPERGWTLLVWQFWSCWFQIWFQIFSKTILTNASAVSRRTLSYRARKTLHGSCVWNWRQTVHCFWMFLIIKFFFLLSLSLATLSVHWSRVPLVHPSVCNDQIEKCKNQNIIPAYSYMEGEC